MNALLIAAVLAIPAMYDRPYEQLVPRAVPARIVAEECRKLYRSYYGSGDGGFKGHNLGCSVGGVLDGGGPCYIIYAHGKLHVRRHEEAHCNGYTHD